MLKTKYRHTDSEIDMNHAAVNEKGQNEKLWSWVLEYVHTDAPLHTGRRESERERRRRKRERERRGQMCRLEENAAVLILLLVLLDLVQVLDDRLRRASVHVRLLQPMQRDTYALWLHTPHTKIRAHHHESIHTY